MRRYFFWFTLFTICSFVLYDIKYNVHTSQSETRKLEEMLISERERLHMLELEWTRLTRPERIAALAQKYLGMENISTQSVMVEDVAMWRVSEITRKLEEQEALQRASLQQQVMKQGERVE